MKLITEKGELCLPSDFSFTIELTNPFFNDEGDASIPASIPATSENIKVLDNLDTIPKRNKFLRKTPAILSTGTYQKHGQLIIDSISHENGIDVSFVLQNSDLYVSSKDKSLKEIFSQRIMNLDDFPSPFERGYWSGLVIVDYLKKIYNGQRISNIFAVFPVAVSKYTENNSEVYQYLNEVDANGDLIYDRPYVIDGNDKIGVQRGYGITPFLYLHALINIMFDELGYEVDYNCFSEPDLKDLVVLNNCADTIVKCQIAFLDLVPSCTLSEFHDFLFKKFCVQFFVDSEKKTVRIEKLQDILSEKKYDLDISKIFAKQQIINISESNRVVLDSGTSLDGASPAAKTFDLLIKNYSRYVELDELQYNQLASNPQIFDCLFVRNATGVFYVLLRNADSGNMVLKELGTNYFKYDRENSEESTSFSSIDEMPRMLKPSSSMIYPYIGEHINYNTADSSDDEQKIILAWRNFDSLLNRSYCNVQKWNNGGNSILHPFSLTTYDMYNYFWSEYNNLLLNNLIQIKGVVNYKMKDLLSWKVSNLKLKDGQLLLPEKFSFDIGNKIKCNESEFILVKDFSDKITDTPILPSTIVRLKWVYDTSQLTQFVNDNVKTLFPSYHDYEGVLICMCPLGVNPMSLFPENSFYLYVLIEESITIEFTDILSGGNIYLYPPTFEGEIKLCRDRQIKVGYKYSVYRRNISGQEYWNYLGDQTGVGFTGTVNTCFVATPY